MIQLQTGTNKIYIDNTINQDEIDDIYTLHFTSDEKNNNKSFTILSTFANDRYIQFDLELVDAVDELTNDKKVYLVDGLHTLVIDNHSNTNILTTIVTVNPNKTEDNYEYKETKTATFSYKQ